MCDGSLILLRAAQANKQTLYVSDMHAYPFDLILLRAAQANKQTLYVSDMHAYPFDLSSCCVRLKQTNKQHQDAILAVGLPPGSLRPAQVVQAQSLTRECTNDKTS